MDREKRFKREPHVVPYVKGDIDGTARVSGARRRKKKRNKNHIYWTNLTDIGKEARITRAEVVKFLIENDLLRADRAIPTHVGIDFHYARFAYGKYEWDKYKVLHLIHMHHQ